MSTTQPPQINRALKKICLRYLIIFDTSIVIFFFGGGVFCFCFLYCKRLMVTSKKSILYDGRQNKYIRHQCIFKQFLFSLENNYIRKPTKLHVSTQIISIVSYKTSPPIEVVERMISISETIKNISIQKFSILSV